MNETTKYCTVQTIYIIVRLQNTGIYRIYNLKALGCGARAKRIISGNILVVKINSGYFACFIWPQRQGSIGKQGIYRAEQGFYEK